MQYTIRQLDVAINFPGKDPVTLVRDISVDLGENEFIGLLGPSGAGKTQLSYALGRLNTFQGNRVISEIQVFESRGKRFNINEIKSLEELRSAELGYIFQEAFSYFNPVLKIRAQLEDLDKLNSKDKAALFTESGLFEMDRILNSYPHQLSGGQLQRLAILQCLCKNPSLIIADEIDSALDEQNAALMMQFIINQKAWKKFSLIWITHDQLKAKQLCDRIWYLDQGALTYDGTPEAFNPVQYDYPMPSEGNVSKDYVRLEMISKSFSQLGKEVFIFKDISLSIRENEIVGLIGSSGSGKSTLAKIIAGLDKLNSGSIFIDGIQTSKERSPNKDIIYLFQDAYSSLNPGWTIKKILDEAITAGRSSFTIDDLLNKGELNSSILDLFPSALSGGMRQRVAIARALAVAPRLLILDESLNALDHKLQVKILNMLITHRNETKMSMLVISHQEDLVKAVCSKIYKIDSGVITLQ